MASTPSASTQDHGFYRRNQRNCVRKPCSRRSPAWRRYIRWVWSSQKTSRLGRGYPDRGGTRPPKSARARSERLGWPCRDAREPIRPSPRRDWSSTRVGLPRSTELELLDAACPQRAMPLFRIPRVGDDSAHAVWKSPATGRRRRHAPRDPPSASSTATTLPVTFRVLRVVPSSP